MASPDTDPLLGRADGPIVGIDLGTTNSLVAIADPGPRILADAHGLAMLPSVVRFDDSGRPIAVGHDARAAAAAHPRATVSSVKRLMGRSLADAVPDLPYLSYTVVAGANNTARIDLPLSGGGRKHITPQEVSAIILGTLRDRASRALGVPVHRAVITVPAYFDDAQRQATRDAARIAGLEAVRIVNEPTAAALAYGLGLRESAGVARKPMLIAVYDLGGGTFDVSILRITPASYLDASVPAAWMRSSHSNRSVSDFFQVLATAGDTHLGGDDLDQRIVAHLVKMLGLGPASLTPEVTERLRQGAEAAKIELSEKETTGVNLVPPPSGSADGAGANGPRVSPPTPPVSLSRADLESLTSGLVNRTLDACRRALRDASRAMGGQPLDAVVLVGGATRMPLVRRSVRDFFGLEPYTALNPDEVVALGAAVQAGVLQRAESPGSESRGARALLLDVIPLSLGVETVGGAAAKLIVRNTTVPARASELFSTSVDNQTGIKLHILQGEREMAADCRSLARLELRGVPPMPAGIPKLRVEFVVDASGILTVRAVEERSGKRLEQQIVPNHGLTQDEVDRIERDSFSHAREDMARHRVVDLIANASLDIGWTRKQLVRLRDAVPAPLREDLEAGLAALEATVRTAQADWRAVSPDAFHEAKESLDRASIPLHELAITKSLRDDGA